MLLTLTHNLIDLPILLSADEFFMFVGKFDLDSNMALCMFDKRYLLNDHHGSFNGVVGPIDGEGKLFEP